MLCALATDIISFFLWHLTWGWQQLIIHSMFFWFCLAVVVPYGWFRSLWYSVLLHLVTSLWLSFAIGFILIFICNTPVENFERYAIVYTETQRVTLSFAAFYNSALFLSALMLRGLMPIPLIRLAVALFMSGITSALLVARLISFG
jgi:hypothetical protein